MAKSIHIKPIRKINCPHCQQTLGVYSSLSHYLGCTKCKSFIDIQNNELIFTDKNLIGLEDSLANLDLSIGMLAKFGERKYVIVARTRYYARFQKYYERNGENGAERGYESDYLTFDEWQLKDLASEDYYSLIQDTQNFYLSKPFISPNPILPDETKSLFTNFVDSWAYRISEYGIATQVFFEGECEVIPPQSLKYWQCSVNDAIYTAELSLDYYANVENVPHYYQISRIPKTITVLEAFAENYSIQKKLENAKILKFARTIVGLFGLVLAILFFYSLLEKKKIFEQNFGFGTSSTTTSLQNNQEWDLPAGLYLVEIEIQSLSSTYDNQEVYVTAEIYDDEDLLVNEIIGDFWSFRGVEDGEAWSESNTYTYKYVHLPEKGKYFAEIYLETNPAIINGNLNIRVRQGGIIWYIMLIPFVFIAIIFTILQLIIYQRKLE